MTDLHSCAATQLRAIGLEASRGTMVVAVSGGVDSMVLLRVLQDLSETFHLDLVAAHFNHRLRGDDSEADAAFVREVAGTAGIPLECGSADIRLLADAGRGSIEMTARRERHRFLAATAVRHAAAAVVLAHHADDAAELFLLRLLRGGGPSGLSAMRVSGPSPADPTIPLIRPFLECRRADIEAFAGREHVAFREDASNRSVDFLRNRIRHELLPLLARDYQPAIVETLLRCRDLIGAEHGLVMARVAGWLDGADDRPFATLAVAEQREVLRRRLWDLGIAGDFQLVEALRQNPGAVFNAAAGRRVRATDDGLVEPIPQTEIPVADPGCLMVDLVGSGGNCRFEGVTFRWRLEETWAASAPTLESGVERFDADRVGRQIRLRHWREGDRFAPIGGPGSVKLQDWFTNRHVPAAERRTLVVAENADGDIFWIENQRIAETARLRDSTRRVLEWAFSRTA